MITDYLIIALKAHFVVQKSESRMFLTISTFIHHIDSNILGLRPIKKIMTLLLIKTPKFRVISECIMNNLTLDVVSQSGD